MDNYNKLYEDSSINSAAYQEQKKEAADEKVRNRYETNAKQMYIMSKKQDALLVNIKMPSELGSNVRIPKAPMDLRALMTPVQTPKDDKKGSIFARFAKKFKNVHGMMPDAIKTFDHADDLAKNVFANLGMSGLKTKHSERDASFNMKSNEAFDYTEGAYNQLNEGYMSIGATVGVLTGGVASIVGYNILAAGAGFLAMTAPLALSLYGIGVGGERAFGDVEKTGLHRSYIDDKAYEDSLETADESSIESDKAWHGDSAIDAINTYIEDLSSSLENALSVIVPGSNASFEEILSDLRSDIASTDKEVEEFHKTNNSRVEKAREMVKQQRMAYAEFKKDNNEKINDFVNKCSALLFVNQENAVEAIKLFQAITKDFSNRIQKQRSGNNLQIIYEYLEADTIEEIKKVYDKYHKTNEALEDGYGLNDMLFEEEAESELVELDITKEYNSIKTNYQNKFSKLFPLLAGAKLPGYEEAKESMKALKKAATDEITGKIDDICRVCTNPSQSQSMGLSRSVAQFLVGHPLQAKTLHGLWARHEQELDLRMNNRLQHMSDYSDANYILGWSKKFCVQVVPDIIARLLVFRKILSILKEDGYYSYTPEMYKEDVAEFEANKEEIMNTISLKIAACLYHHGKEYTEGNQELITRDEQGLFTLTDAEMTYATLLAINLLDNKRGVMWTPSIGYYFAQYGKKSKDFQLLSWDLIDAIDKQNSGLLSDQNINQLMDKFAIKPEQKEAIPFIKATYDKLLGSKIIGADAKKVGYSIAALNSDFKKGKKIFEAYVANKETLQGLKDDKEIKSTLKYNIDEDLEYKPIDLKASLVNEKNIPDYYAFIYSLYCGMPKNISHVDNATSLHIKEVTGTDYKITDYKEVCKVTLAYMELVTSGYLAEKDIEVSKLEGALAKAHTFCGDIAIAQSVFEGLKLIVDNSTAKDDEPIDDIHTLKEVKDKVAEFSTNYEKFKEITLKIANNVDEKIFSDFDWDTMLEAIQLIAEYGDIKQLAKEFIANDKLKGKFKNENGFNNLLNALTLIFNKDAYTKYASYSNYLDSFKKAVNFYNAINI